MPPPLTASDPPVMFGKPVIRGTRIADRAAKAPRLLSLLDEVAEGLHGSFAVLEVDRVRLRPLSPGE